MSELQLKDLVPGKRYIDKDGDEFEFIAHSKTRHGREAFADYGQRIGAMLLFGHVQSPFLPAPERHSRIFVILADDDGSIYATSFFDMESALEHAGEFDKKILAAKQVFITEGEFSEGLQP